MALSRPPGQFVVSKGKSYQLVANEYDKNKYSQCTYVSQRTLIKCKQIRSKEELAKNGGKCEEHEILTKMVRNNYDKEMLRVRAECDTGNGSKKRRFSTFIVSNDCISDEEDWLQPGNTMFHDLPDQVHCNLVDDHPLRNAEHFSDKDVIRMNAEFCKQDIEDLRQFKNLLTAQASRVCEKLNDDNDKACLLDGPQARAYEASNHYDQKDYLRIPKTSNLNLEICTFGHNIPDSEIVSDVVEEILDRLEKKALKPMKEPCKKKAIDRTGFCYQHILEDKSQKLLAKCTICGDVALGTDDPTCAYHRKELVYHRAMNPFHNVRKGEEDVPAKEPQYDGFRSHMNIPKIQRIDIDTSDEEDNLANLGHLEQMGSPLAPIGQSGTVPYIQHGRKGFYSQQQQQPTSSGQLLLRQQQFHSPYQHLQDGKATLATKAQPTAQQISEVVKSRSELEQATCRCARERPFDPLHFNKAEKRPPVQQKVVKQTPRVLSSSATGLGTSPTGRGTIGANMWQMPSQQRHYVGGRGVKIQQGQQYYGQQQQPVTRFPVNQPRTISLEAAGGGDKQMDTVHGVSYPRYSNDAPRGVPYLKHGAGFHRNPASHPQQQQQHQPRVEPVRHSTHQMPATQRRNVALPPHRQIAMGMKPAEMQAAMLGAQQGIQDASKQDPIRSQALGLDSVPKVYDGKTPIADLSVKSFLSMTGSTKPLSPEEVTKRIHDMELEQLQKQHQKQRTGLQHGMTPAGIQKQPNVVQQIPIIPLERVGQGTSGGSGQGPTLLSRRVVISPRKLAVPIGAQRTPQSRANPNIGLVRGPPGAFNRQPPPQYQQKVKAQLQQQQQQQAKPTPPVASTLVKSAPAPEPKPTPAAPVELRVPFPELPLQQQQQESMLIPVLTEIIEEKPTISRPTEVKKRKAEEAGGVEEPAAKKKPQQTQQQQKEQQVKELKETPKKNVAAAEASKPVVKAEKKQTTSASASSSSTSTNSAKSTEGTSKPKTSRSAATPTKTSAMDSLAMLAEVSAMERQKEEQRKSSSVSPRGSAGGSAKRSRKSPTPKPQPRRSSRTAATPTPTKPTTSSTKPAQEEEFEEEL